MLHINANVGELAGGKGSLATIRNYNEDIEADLSSRHSPSAARIESRGNQKVDEGVKACERRIVENKATGRQNRKKFSQLMSFDDSAGLKVLEKEIKHLNRLNGINQKMIRETAQLRRQKSKVIIHRADGSKESFDFDF